MNRSLRVEFAAISGAYGRSAPLFRDNFGDKQSAAGDLRGGPGRRGTDIGRASISDAYDHGGDVRNELAVVQTDGDSAE